MGFLADPDNFHPLEGMALNENGKYRTVNLQLRERTLEVLLPHLARAMDAPFEEHEVQTELGNVHNIVRSTLQTPV